MPELSKGAGTVHVRKKRDERAKKKKNPFVSWQSIYLFCGTVILVKGGVMVRLVNYIIKFAVFILDEICC